MPLNDGGDIGRLSDIYPVTGMILRENPGDYLLKHNHLKTGKVVLSSDAVERGSFLNTIACQISQLAFDHLDGPPVVVGSRNWITPGAEMEDMFFPQTEWIIDAIHERLLPLHGHTVMTNQTIGEMLRRNRKGI